MPAYVRGCPHSLLIKEAFASEPIGMLLVCSLLRINSWTVNSVMKEAVKVAQCVSGLLVWFNWACLDICSLWLAGTGNHFLWCV